MNNTTPSSADGCILPQGFQSLRLAEQKPQCRCNRCAGKEYQKPSTLEKVREDKKEFWKEIIYKDGKIDEEQVMKELLDFSDMMHRFGCFLDHATGGRMSKLNYTIGAMCSEHDDYHSQQYKFYYEDEAEELLEGNQRLTKKVKIAEEALETIREKECKHCYTEKVMADSCEACSARVALDQMNSM